MHIAIFENEEWSRDAWQPLERDHAVSINGDLLTHANAARAADAEALVVDLSAVDGPLLDRLPRVTLVAARATGVDKIDLAACRERGITVCNVPGYAAVAVAEHVFALLLAVSRRVVPAVERVRRGDFTFDGLEGFELCGRTLAVVGTGAIGRHVAAIARGFGMPLLAVDAYPDHAWADANAVRYVDLDTALAGADAVTLHLPATPETRNLIGAAQLGRMRPGAVLVNTARGELVDSRALVQALDKGRPGAAALDVLPGEQALRGDPDRMAALLAGHADAPLQLANHLLMRHPRVVLTPHCAFMTREAARRVLATTVANIEAFVRGAPQNVLTG